MAHWAAGDAPPRSGPPPQWAIATDEDTDLVADEYAYLTDRRRGTAGPDWNVVRNERAARAFAVLATLDE